VADEKFFATEEVDGVLVVRAKTNRVRTDEADELAKRLLAEPAEGESPGARRVCINLDGVEFVDSGALAVLWRVNENTSSRFCHVSELVKGTFKILGILNALLLHETEAQALKAFADHAR
jgi:anti-anti-sigma regulatory factor